jgi:hypothetical protein
MTDRDTFAAAALTGLLSRSIAPEQAMSQYVRIAAAYADAMLRERDFPSESSVPLGNGGGCGGTDKPVTLPAVGTGNLSEAEIDALEFVVEEGRIASMDDYGVLRSLIVRLRPEWENQSYKESNENRMNTNMNRDTTPSDGSVQSGGAVAPAAWLAVAADGSESSAVYMLKEQAEAAAREWGWFVAPLYALPVLRAEDEIAIEAAWERTGLTPTWPADEAGCGVKYANAMAQEIERLRQFDRLQPIEPADAEPLYRSPTLTAEEREAIYRAEARLRTAYVPDDQTAATLRKLLERMK